MPNERFLVWIIQPMAYFAFWACAILYAGGGHGSTLPLAAFWGWSVAVLDLFRPSDLAAVWPLFLATGLQLAAYAFLWMFLESRRLGWRAGLLLPVLHLSGVALCVWLRPLDEFRLLDEPFGLMILLAAWTFASNLLIGYWAALLGLLHRSVSRPGKRRADRISPA